VPPVTSGHQGRSFVFMYIHWPAVLLDSAESDQQWCVRLQEPAAAQVASHGNGIAAME